MTNQYLVLHTNRSDASKSKTVNVEATSPVHALCVVEGCDKDEEAVDFYTNEMVNFSKSGWVVEGEESDVYVLLK